MVLKRKAVVGGAVALAAAATVTVLALRPTHPLQQHRWEDLHPISNCGPGPALTVEFGRDGLVHYESVIYPSGYSVPYTISGNRITFGSGAESWEGEYTISGNSLAIRMLGMTGEWENYTYHYVAK